jgi:hypothetical protein
VVGPSIICPKCHKKGASVTDTGDYTWEKGKTDHYYRNFRCRHCGHAWIWEFVASIIHSGRFIS